MTVWRGGFRIRPSGIEGVPSAAAEHVDDQRWHVLADHSQRTSAGVFGLSGACRGLASRRLATPTTV